MAPAEESSRGTIVSGPYRFACRARTGARHTTHSGQPPDPYLCVGEPQPAHGPTCAGGHVGTGGAVLGDAAGVLTRSSYG